MDSVMRAVGVFALIGTFVAYRRYQRYQREREPDPERKPDPFPTVVRWSVVGVGMGLAYELFRGVVEL